MTKSFKEKMKEVFALNSCKCIKKNKYSILSWSTFFSNYKLKSFWVRCYKFGKPVFWAVSPLFHCRTFYTPSGWMGSAAVLPFSDLFRSIQLLSSWASGQALERVLVVPNFFCWQMMETVLTDTTKSFLYPSPDLCKSCLRGQQSFLWTSWFGFCCDMHCQLWHLL